MYTRMLTDRPYIVFCNGNTGYFSITKDYTIPEPLFNNHVEINYGLIYTHVEPCIEGGVLRLALICTDHLH